MRLQNLPARPTSLEFLFVKKSHPLYEVWRGMIRRCHDAHTRGYRNYGGRGISVCAQWRKNFGQFVCDVPLRPSTGYYTLERIDNNLGYEPSNIRWATCSEQMRNTRFNRLITANGKTQTLEEWVAETGFPKSTLANWRSRPLSRARLECLDSRQSPSTRMVFRTGDYRTN